MLARRVLAILLALACAITATSCRGKKSQPPAAENPPQLEATNTPPAAVPTATLIVLITPTPKPAPPTVPVAEVSQHMVEIPADSFTMGSDTGDPEDGPAHQVDLPAFEIDRFEVTNSDFARFVEETGYATYAEQQGYNNWRGEWGQGEDNHPVVTVTWDDAAAYCEWAGKHLPTEAQWEKAARGEDGRAFPWGNEWDPTQANVKETGLRGTTAVGSFVTGASPFGAHDMTGNVWEWTADWYQAYPGNTVEDQYYGERFRVTRGGGWFDEEAQSTTFNRNAAEPVKTANDDLGFRCAR